MVVLLPGQELFEAGKQVIVQARLRMIHFKTRTSDGTRLEWFNEFPRQNAEVVR
jgi:hypothetical protein